ncbi:hypothetical protein N7467_010156 [Penicillium canescens]|nr:hypothetical protein N7467_010156 [Penicillium canescens]
MVILACCILCEGDITRSTHGEEIQIKGGWKNPNKSYAKRCGGLIKRGREPALPAGVLVIEHIKKDVERPSGPRGYWPDPHLPPKNIQRK